MHYYVLIKRSATLGTLLVSNISMEHCESMENYTDLIIPINVVNVMKVVTSQLGKGNSWLIALGYATKRRLRRSLIQVTRNTLANSESKVED